MCLSRGSTFQVEETASTKAQRQERAWCWSENSAEGPCCQSFVKGEMDGNREGAKGHVHLSGEGMIWQMLSSPGIYPVSYETGVKIGNHRDSKEGLRSFDNITRWLGWLALCCSVYVCKMVSARLQEQINCCTTNLKKSVNHPSVLIIYLNIFCLILQ